VEFIKRTNNTHRVMVCRTGVKKDLKGVGHSFDPEKKNLLCVWDMKKEAYRMVSIDSIVRIKVDGRAYTAVSGGMVPEDTIRHETVA
jgi:hypothetical protein